MTDVESLKTQLDKHIAEAKEKSPGNLMSSL